MSHEMKGSLVYVTQLNVHITQRSYNGLDSKYVYLTVVSNDYLYKGHFGLLVLIMLWENVLLL